MKPHSRGLDELALSRCRVVIDVLDRRGPDDDPARCTVGGIGVRGNLRQGIVEFPHGIQGFARRSFHGPLPASNSLRERRTGLRSGRGLRDVPFLGRRSPYRPRPHRRCHLALLHRLPGSDLLGCGLRVANSWRAASTGAATAGAFACGAATGGAACGGYLGRRRLWRRYLGRCHLGRRVFGRRRSGRGVIGCGFRGGTSRAAVSRDVKLCGTEICGANSWGSESWRMENCGAEGSGAVAACRPSVKGWSAAGSSGASTGPAFAVPRAAAQGRPRWEQFRSKCSQPCCAQEEAAGGSETSVWASSGRSTARSKAGTPTAITPPNAIRAAAMTKRRCEYKAHLLQAAPAPRRFRARTTVRGGTMSVWGAGSQRKSKLCLTRRGPWGQGAIRRKLGPRGKTLQPGQSSDSGRPAGVCQTPRSTLDWSQQRRMAVDI